MIYFDNAATSWPKPTETKIEVYRVMEDYGANPGRGAYAFAKATAAYMEDARKEIAAFLGVIPAKNLIFTSGDTESANLVLKSCLKPGEHLLYTAAEHNATGRCIKWLESAGIEATKVNLHGNEKEDLRAFESQIRKNTRLFVINHGSNVFGYIQPLAEIVALAKKYEILVFADMAQTAGFLDTEVAAAGVDFAAFAGHKSLLGYGGIGALYLRDPRLVKPLLHGGTGSFSHLTDQPQIVPSGFEAGTRNLLGVASLLGGIRYLKKRGLGEIREHETELCNRFLAGLKNMDQVEVYGFPQKIRLPVVSLNLRDRAPGDVALELSKRADICVRAGLHCAPFAHETIGTAAAGTVRFSFGPFNTAAEIDTALDVLATMK